MKSRTRSMLAKRRRRTGHRRAGITRRILERWGKLIAQDLFMERPPMLYPLIEGHVRGGMTASVAEEACRLFFQPPPPGHVLFSRQQDPDRW